MNSKFLIILAILSIASGVFGDDPPSTVKCQYRNKTDPGNENVYAACTGKYCYFANFTRVNYVGDKPQDTINSYSYGCTDGPVVFYDKTPFTLSIGRCDSQELQFDNYNLIVNTRLCNNRDNCTDTCSSNRPQVFLAALFLILISKILFF